MEQGMQQPFRQAEALKAHLLAWQQQADLLAHLCCFSQNVLCVVAPSGGGKTEFIDYFLSLSFPGLCQHALYAAPNNIEDLLMSIAEELQLTDYMEGKIGFQSSLSARLQTTDSSWVLLVDDADQLSESSLKTLLKLSQPTANSNLHLHLVLFGGMEFERVLSSEPYLSLLNGQCHIVELTQSAPNASQSPVLETDIQDEQNDWLSLDEKRWVPDCAADNKVAQKNQDAEFLGFIGLERIMNVMYVNKLRTLLAHPVTLGALAGIILGVVYLTLNPLDDAEWQNTPAHAAQLAAPNWQTSASQLSSPTAKINLALSTPELQPDEENMEDIFPEKQNIPLAEQLPELMLDADDDTPLAPSRHASTYTHTLASSVKVPSALQAVTAGEKQLLAADSKFYTLQLIGGRNPEGAQEFIKSHQLVDKAYTYRKQVNGQDWYVVLLGQYASKEAADRAAASLPEPIKKQAKPWVRSMNTVQREIKSGHS